eukprot:gene9168-6447_t
MKRTRGNTRKRNPYVRASAVVPYTWRATSSAINNGPTSKSSAPQHFRSVSARGCERKP